MSKTLRLLRFSLGQLLAGRRLVIVAVLVALPLVLPAVFASGADVAPATLAACTKSRLTMVRAWPRRMRASNAQSVSPRTSTIVIIPRCFR